MPKLTGPGTRKVRARAPNKLIMRRMTLEITRQEMARMLNVTLGTYCRFEMTEMANSMGQKKKHLLSKITELPLEIMYDPVVIPLDDLINW
jgi:DNA-binding XRE family transcriptional regulator